MKKLKDLLKYRLNEHKIGKSSVSAVILHKANLILKERFPQSEEDVNAYCLSNKCLYIRVSHATWAQEVQMDKNNILSAIDQFYKDEVKEIRIKHLTTC